jgi:hypothetical protein
MWHAEPIHLCGTTTDIAATVIHSYPWENRNLRLGMVQLLTILVFSGTAFAEQPIWITERPNASAYFIGIGIGAITSSREEALRVGTQNALGDIATQIEVTVDSRTELTIRENEVGAIQDYESASVTSVSTQLENVEIVDTWETDDEIWVYARLSRIDHEQSRQEKIEQARRRTFDLVKRADQVVSQDPIESLRLLIQALRPLNSVSGNPLRVEYRGSRIDLEAEVPAKIRALLSSFTLAATSPRVPIKAGNDIDLSVSVRASRKSADEHKPLFQAPLVCAFVEGEGEVSNLHTVSDENGISVMRIARLSGRSRRSVIRAQLDLDAIAGDQPYDPASLLMLSSMNPPYIDIPLNVASQSVLIDGVERNLGVTLDMPLLEPALRELLTEGGLECVDERNKADLLVTVNAGTRKGNRMGTLHFSYLDLSVSVKRLSDNTEICEVAESNIKGAGGSFSQAGIKAYSKAKKVLEDVVLVELMKRL